LKKDIETRDDIRLIVTQFYEKLLQDKTMRPFFAEVVKKGLKEHFDILVDFWDTIIFYSGTYQRNAMAKHIEINQNISMHKDHFNSWLTYFNETVDENFKGKNSFIAKTRALSIATVMQIKILK